MTEKLESLSETIQDSGVDGEENGQDIQKKDTTDYGGGAG